MAARSGCEGSIPVSTMATVTPRPVERAQAWWGLATDPGRLAVRLADVTRRHAKLATREYGPQARAHEVELLSRMHAPTLQAANNWMQRHVLPAMRQQAIDLSAGQWSLKGRLDEY